jgi:hypothetical protein
MKKAKTLITSMLIIACGWRVLIAQDGNNTSRGQARTSTPSEQGAQAIPVGNVADFAYSDHLLAETVGVGSQVILKRAVTNVSNHPVVYYSLHIPDMIGPDGRLYTCTTWKLIGIAVRGPDGQIMKFDRNKCPESTGLSSQRIPLAPGETLRLPDVRLDEAYHLTEGPGKYTIDVRHVNNTEVDKSNLLTLTVKP